MADMGGVEDQVWKYTDRFHSFTTIFSIWFILINIDFRMKLISEWMIDRTHSLFMWSSIEYQEIARLIRLEDNAGIETLWCYSLSIWLFVLLQESLILDGCFMFVKKRYYSHYSSIMHHLSGWRVNILWMGMLKNIG